MTPILARAGAHAGPASVSADTRARVTAANVQTSASPVASRPCHVRVQGDENLVQLLEGLDHSVRKAGAGSVESFLRGVEIAHNQQRLATFFLEGQRGDGSTLTTFFIRPDEA